MRRLLSAWDELDPALSRLLRFNYIALTVTTVGLGLVYALAFRHPNVLVDLGVMVCSLLLVTASLPFTRRFGARAPIVGLTASVTTFSVGSTWVTPSLSPLSAMLMMLPLFVGFPHLSRSWVRFLMVYAVLGSMALAALGEVRRVAGSDVGWPTNATTVMLSLPSVTVVMIYLVHDAYRRLREQADALRETSVQLVQAADSARRDIERDLHDGAQQRLLAMSVTIERARRELERDNGAEAARLVDDISADTRTVLRELRELARGIYPPLLTERGLVAAVQAGAREAPVPIRVEAEEFPRPRPEVETAAYFCILEAATNAVRHGRCREITVRLRALPGLEFVVTDDGVGFDPDGVQLSGLRGLRARMTAAGGTIQLRSTPGRGTEVIGRFPA